MRKHGARIAPHAIMVMRHRFMGGAHCRGSSGSGGTMRAYGTTGFVAIFSLICAFSVFGGADSTVTPERISQLIARLGSSRFKDREEAGAALEAIGPPALAALKQAVHDRDPEVRRRAETLASAIHKRVETAQLLEPKRVHLSLHEVGVPEAVARLARQSGYAIEIGESPQSLSALPGPRSNSRTELEEPTVGDLFKPLVTLDTGETSFWQAFDQLCAKCSLVERSNAVVGQSGTAVWNAQAVAGQRIMAPIPGVPSVGYSGKLLLEPGDPVTWPTCYAGSVRVRARPTPPVAGATPRRKGDPVVTLEVSPEPKLAWQGIVDFQIEKAVDERDRSVTAAGSGRDHVEMLGVQAQANGVILWDVEGRPRGLDIRSIPIRFKTSGRRIKMLKELTGTISAHVLTPPQALITVDGIAHAGGETIHGPNGESLTVMNVDQTPKGEVRIKLRLEGSPARWNGNNAVRGNIIIRRNGMVWRGAGGSEGPLSGDNSFRLYDSQGQSIRQKGRGVEMVAVGNGITEELTLIYELGDKAKADKLVYSGRRSVMVDVPFTLKNVPLP